MANPAASVDPGTGAATVEVAFSFAAAATGVRFPDRTFRVEFLQDITLKDVRNEPDLEVMQCP